MKAPAPELTSFEARRQRVEHLRMRSSVLAIPTHPSFAHHNAKKRLLPCTKRGKRSAERRIVLPMSAPQTSLRSLRNLSVAACATFFSQGAPTFRRSRLRHSPPASTPMAQLQNRVSLRRPRTGVSPASPTRCRRLSTLRADRSLCRSTGDPKPPGNGLTIPPAGTAPRSHQVRRHRLTSLNNQRDGRRYLHRRGEVKGVSILVVESKHFAARALFNAAALQ